MTLMGLDNRPSLSLETLNLIHAASPAHSARSVSWKHITPLPSPSGSTSFEAEQQKSAVGKRTNDFFGSPVTATPPSFIARNDQLVDTPISNLPSSVHTSPPRARKTVPSSLGLGDSPARRSVSLTVSGLGLPHDPPSRLPSLPPEKSLPSLSTPPRSESPSPLIEDVAAGTVLNQEYIVEKRLGIGAFSKVMLCTQQATSKLYAVKMIDRATVEKNDRMRISLLREVEVLKHIKHPSLVHLVASFNSPTCTCLVLEYAAGGELFELVTKKHQEFTEPFTRRIFGELADVLGWMHSIALVHRDIKLENILLTKNPFPWHDDAEQERKVDKKPLIKLTDFGLSRFIDLNDPVLRTRCGSEEYAAPELIMGQPYDGRKTDSWALGVVLYAILTSHLPFFTSALTISHETSNGHLSSPAVSRPGTPHSEKANRRSRLMRIAKADYTWPDPVDCPLATLPAKEIVDALLVRDPDKRSRVDDLWSLDWLRGPGSPLRKSRLKSEDDEDSVWVKRFGKEQEVVLKAEVEPQ